MENWNGQKYQDVYKRQVVEVKIVAFTSRDIGQIGTYVNIVDDLVRNKCK